MRARIEEWLSCPARLALLLGAVLLALLSGCAASPILTFHASERETVVDFATRNRGELRSWPDGNIGVVREAPGLYSFYAANSAIVSKTSGPLESPAQQVISPGIYIRDSSKRYNYAGGGSVYRDPHTARLLLVYHTEMHRGGDAKRFFSTLALALSDDHGSSFSYLGEIVSTEVTYDDPQAPPIVEMTGGSFAIHNGYFYLYFRDYLRSGRVNELAVARARVKDVLDAAGQGEAAAWRKYYNGSFSEPGLGGRSSPLEQGNPNVRWTSVSYNDFCRRFVLVGARNEGSDVNLYVTTSIDGLRWAPRAPLEREAGESFYPTIVGAGDDPLTTGQSFYVYYTYSAHGEWNRWQDGILVRRLVKIEKE